MESQVRPTLEECGSVERDFEFVSCPPSPSMDALCASELFDEYSKTDLPESVAFRCPSLTESQFLTYFDGAGRLVDEHAFKKAVFRGGCEKAVRSDIWMYLFSFYPCLSTSLERQAIKRNKVAHYTAVKNKWLNYLLENYPDFDLSLADNCIMEDKPAYESFVNNGTILRQNEDCQTDDCDNIEAQMFARRLEIKGEYFIESLRYISKDVPRTDRAHEYFSRNVNAHLIELRDALVTFCILNPELGYVQGMNDLMARFLVVLDSEALAFWCFNCYVQNVRDEFSSSGMVKKIGLMASLLKRLDGVLHKFLASHNLADLVFCHKWLLLCFQRELGFDEGLRLLEIVSTRQIGSNTPLGLKIIEECRKERRDLDVNVECEMTYHEYTFDLFIAVAILTLNRSEIMKSESDDSDVLQAILQSPLHLKLDDILNEAEKLFYLYCRNSVLYSF